VRGQSLREVERYTRAAESGAARAQCDGANDGGEIGKSGIVLHAEKAGATMQLSKAFALAFTVVSVLFAVPLSLSTGAPALAAAQAEHGYSTFSGVFRLSNGKGLPHPQTRIGLSPIRRME
jgi:hypothetical protein